MPEENEELEQEQPIEEENNEQAESDLEDSGSNENVAEASKDTIGNIMTKKKIVTFLLANPWFLIIAGVIVLILIIMILIILNQSNENFDRIKGLGDLPFYDPRDCTTVHVHSSGNPAWDIAWDIEEYVEAVVSAEVRGFNNLVTFEVFAIAARTYALSRMDSNCSIAGNTTRQAIYPPGVNDLIREGVANTRGIVMTRGGSLINAEYDAFAVVGNTGTHYILSQASLRIPISWAVERRVPLRYRETCPFNRDLSPNPSACYSGGRYRSHHHGRGMSQYGALYLAVEMGKTYDQILRYFYGDFEFASIYMGFGFGPYFGGSPSNGTCMPTAPPMCYTQEPDPSCPINFMANRGNPVDPSKWIYPLDGRTGLPLGAWPSNYYEIPTRVSISRTYAGGRLIWPMTGNSSGVHGTPTGIDMFNWSHPQSGMGEPIYAPFDGILISSQWGGTTNRGLAETAYVIRIRANPSFRAGTTQIHSTWIGHLAGIVFRCSSEADCRNLPNGGRIQKGDLIGFNGNAAGVTGTRDGRCLGVGGFAPHPHFSLRQSSGAGYSGILTVYGGSHWREAGG